MSTWDRIECMARSIGLEGGLQAQIADPLWMLARQWQVAEFRGDDAAQPAGVRVTARNLPLTGLSGAAGGQRPLPDTMPLEAAVEAAPEPDLGAAGVFAAARASRRLIRTLGAAGLGGAVDALRAAFPLTLPDRLVAFGSSDDRLATLYARRGIDAAALAKTPPAVVGKALAGALAPADTERARQLIASWALWYGRRRGEAGAGAWEDERLEHRFTLSAGDGAAQGRQALTIQAPEHTGGHLDWYSFDLAAPVRPAGAPQTRSHTAIPAPVQYQGMPAARWWQFEDWRVNFGAVEAGPADLARLVVAEFATTYSRDWFVVPISLPVGSLTEVRMLEVIDNFGGRARISSTAINDARRGGDRVWRMFELTGDEVSDGHPSPWLLVAPTLASDVSGPALERVHLARDEGANLVWAIEGLVEGLLGRAVDRSEAWAAARPAEQGPRDAAEPARPRFYDRERWRYRLEAAPPPWWIPFLPERIDRDSAQTRLRRARMQAWELVTDARARLQLGPQGQLLDPRGPRWLVEAEIPRSGVRVERRWQFARWHDGSYHVWLQRRKLPGRGERSGGLRWDVLLPDADVEGAP